MNSCHIDWLYIATTNSVVCEVPNKFGLVVPRPHMNEGMRRHSMTVGMITKPEVMISLGPVSLLAAHDLAHVVDKKQGI